MTKHDQANAHSPPEDQDRQQAEDRAQSQDDKLDIVQRRQNRIIQGQEGAMVHLLSRK